jgi:hypothetical protein
MLWSAILRNIRHSGPGLNAASISFIDSEA